MHNGKPYNSEMEINKHTIISKIAKNASFVRIKKNNFVIFVLIFLLNCYIIVIR